MSEFSKYLPSHYEEMERPNFEGNGHHSVRDLEKLCYLFRDYTHQENIIKHEIKKERDELLEALQDLDGHFCGFTPSEIEAAIKAKAAISKALGKETAHV